MLAKQFIVASYTQG